MRSNSSKVIGLVPAAGYASRLSPLPMSKELLPVDFGLLGQIAGRPKLAAEYLIETMVNGGMEEAFVIIRPGKWDIPAFFGDGSALGIRLAYLTVHSERGVPFTLDQAFPFVQGKIVALGFPDILFWPRDAFGTVIKRLRRTNADVVLGLFPTDQPDQVGVVDFDTRGVVRRILEKSATTQLPFMWAIAAWKPRFTEFLHEFLRVETHAIGDGTPVVHQQEGRRNTELPIGDVIQNAIRKGLLVEAEVFQQGQYIDVGTPAGLLTAVKSFLQPS